jgi:hypothetical protein
MCPRPTPFAEAPGGLVRSSIKTMPLEGKTAHLGGDVCELRVLLAKSLPSGSFSFSSEQTGVTLKAKICYLK